MQSVINKILAPHTTLGDIFPADVDLTSVKREIRAALRHALSGVSPVADPFLINVCGLPASGKTYICRAFKAANAGMLYISFDAIMEALPTYLSEHLRDRKKSFERWELPARFVGYQLLKQAVRHRLPILFEHSNATVHHIELYEKIKQSGYTVDIRYISADPELILPRLEKRERYFSPERTRERANVLRELMPVFKRTATFFSVLPPWRES